MEHVVRESIYPEAPSQTPRLRLLPLLLIVVILLAGSAVDTIGAIAMAQYTLTLPNPFPAYVDVFPGQPARAIEMRAFLCQDIYDFYHRSTEDQDSTEKSCIFVPAAGIFLSVQAIISEGKIQELTFILRDNTLQVGDLEMFLKMPTLHTLHRAAFFFLPGTFVRAETANYCGQFSLFLPVSSITFRELT